MTGRIDSIMSSGVTFYYSNDSDRVCGNTQQHNGRTASAESIGGLDHQELDEAADFHFTYFTDIWGATPEQDE